MSTWVATSVAITALPLLILFLGISLADMDFNITVLLFCPLFGGILYILSRAVTLVLAFTSLRNLPPGIYEMCRSWNSFAVSTIFFTGYIFRKIPNNQSLGVNGSETTQKWNKREDLKREGEDIYEPLRVSRGGERNMRLTKSRWREAIGSQRPGVQFDGLSLSTGYTIGYNISHNKQIKKKKQIHSARRTKWRTTPNTGLLHSLVSNTIAWSNPEKNFQPTLLPPPLFLSSRKVLSHFPRIDNLVIPAQYDTNMFSL